jgi:hypothetical protein
VAAGKDAPQLTGDNLLRSCADRRPITAADVQAGFRGAGKAAPGPKGTAAPPVRAVTLEDVQGLLRGRMEEARNGGPGKLGTESYSRRANMAYLLYVLAKAPSPGNPNQPLYPRGPERVEVVVGLFQLANAAADLSEALAAGQRRTYEEILGDRSGYPMEVAGKKVMVPGFVPRYQAELQRLVGVVAEVRREEARLERLKAEGAQAKQRYEERKEHYEAVAARLVAARKETALQAAELRRLEQQLFRAQLDLASAARTNEELEREIRKAEQSAGGRKKR